MVVVKHHLVFRASQLSGEVCEEVDVIEVHLSGDFETFDVFKVSSFHHHFVGVESESERVSQQSGCREDDFASLRCVGVGDDVACHLLGPGKEEGIHFGGEHLDAIVFRQVVEDVGVLQFRHFGAEDVDVAE